MKPILIIIAVYLIGLGIQSRPMPEETVSAFISPTPTTAPVIASVPPTPIQSMLDLVNQERAKRGVTPLKANPQLNASAKIKACDLRDRDYWSHIDPDGREPWHLFTEAGYKYNKAGENLARYYASDKLAMIDLMKSASHSANILDPEYDDLGIGVCDQYTVQHFGSLD